MAHTQHLCIYVPRYSPDMGRMVSSKHPILYVSDLVDPSELPVHLQ